MYSGSALKIARMVDGMSFQGVQTCSQEGQSEEDARRCPACGGRLGLKLATSGGFIGCSNYPDCSYTRPLDLQALGEGGEEATGGQLTPFPAYAICLIE